MNKVHRKPTVRKPRTSPNREGSIRSTTQLALSRGEWDDLPTQMGRREVRSSKRDRAIPMPTNVLTMLPHEMGR